MQDAALNHLGKASPRLGMEHVQFFCPQPETWLSSSTSLAHPLSSNDCSDLHSTSSVCLCMYTNAHSIIFLIAASTALGTVTACLLAVSTIVDVQDRVRAERLVARDKSRNYLKDLFDEHVKPHVQPRILEAKEYIQTLPRFRRAVNGFQRLHTGAQRDTSVPSRPVCVLFALAQEFWVCWFGDRFLELLSQVSCCVSVRMLPCAPTVRLDASNPADFCVVMF